MNRIFRVVWCRVLGIWVVASELATRGNGTRCIDDSRRTFDATDDARAAASQLRLAVILVLLALQAPTWAADRYWDVNGTTAGRGGSGIWNTNGAFWGPNINGTTGPYTGWNNAALDDAFFGGTAGTVTLGEPITVHNATFESTGYTVAGSTLTLAGVAPTITTNANVTTTISSGIAGTAGLTKAGAGTLTLNGAKTFSGGLTVNAGTLGVNNDAALGDASNGIVMADGTRLNSGAPAFATSRVVTLTNGNVTLSGAGLGTARFTGAGGVTLLPGTNMRNNTNDYAGQTVFNGTAGTYSFTSIANLGVASALGAPTTVASGTVLAAATSGSVILDYTGTGGISNRNFSLQNSGGLVRLRNSGSGALTLMGDISLGGSAGVTTVTFDAINSDLALLGVISNVSAKFVALNGPVGRTITLGGANTWSAAAIVSGGVTVVAPVLADRGVASSFGTAAANNPVSTFNINSNSKVSYTGGNASSDRGWLINNGTIGNDGTGALALSGVMAITNTATLGGSFSGAPNSVSGVISGAGTLTVNSAGTWILSAANTYTGGTTISAGTLQIGHNNFTGSIVGDVVNNGTLAFGRTNFMTFDGGISGSGSVHQLSSGTTKLTGNSTYTGGTTISAGTLEVGNGGTSGAILGNVTNNSTLAFDRSDNVNFDGAISGTGTVTKLGPNTLTLTANNSYLGNTNVSFGTLQIGSGGASGTLGTGAVTLAGGSSLAFNRSDDTLVSNPISGAGALTQVGSGSTVVTNAVTVGATSISDGVLDVGSGSSFTSPTITLNAAGPNGAAFNVHGTAAAGAGAGAATLLTGIGSDAHTVAVFAGGMLLGNTGAGELGAGNDTLDVAGTLDTVGGVFNLGAGNDTFTLREGADVMGAVDGGAGINTFNPHVDGVANLGAATNFQVLSKTGSGVLNINGPQTSVFDTVFLQGGTLHVAAGATVDPQTTVVNRATTLTVDGSYQGTTGTDTFTLAGIVNGGGTIDLLDGDDVLTLNDGADLSGLTSLLRGGTHATGDVLALNNAAAMAFDANEVVEFEQLQKTNTGVATLTSEAAFASTAINDGVLDVDGALSTGFINVADGAALNVDGIVQAATDTPTAITGNAGTNTVTVGNGGFLLASGDLGDGFDVLDVAGTLDTAGGVFALGVGDDTFTLRDGANIVGSVDGGIGTNTFNTHIDGVADLGASTNFQVLSKSGGGILNINGPRTSIFGAVILRAGTVHVATGATVDPQTTVVDSATTLTVDGSYQGTSGADTFTVAGTVNGSGAIELLDGDDVLTLNDGGDLAGLTTLLDGGAHGVGDTVVLNNTATFAFDADAIVNFESLQKVNTGAATVSDSATFTSTAINGGLLDVVGTLNTGTIAVADGASLRVDGIVQAANGAPTAITGSSGTNTVAVGAGGFLLASGDLGGGVDVLDVAGTLDTLGGVLTLGVGDDTFNVHDGTNVVGNVDGGGGLDTRLYDIDASANLGALLNFEGLTKTGIGVLHVTGPDRTSLFDVEVLGGTLTIGSGATLASQNTIVSPGSTLEVEGAFTGTAGDDSFVLAGTVRGRLAFDAGDDHATFSRGADFSGLTGLSGGVGLDGLSFEGLVLSSDTLPIFDGWEAMNLRAGSTLALNSLLDLTGSGVLSIDATSQLFASAGARLNGNLNNAGRIITGYSRFAITGDYAASSALALTVSPASLSSGGLDIGGDVTGTTHVVFDSDGSEAPSPSGSILVISSPNDNRGTAGSFTPAGSTPGGLVHLDGSAFAWLFDQQADNNWYLTAAVSPEVGGLAVLPGISQADTQESIHLLFDRLSGVRDESHRCHGREEDVARGSTSLASNCQGAWLAATGRELDMGADPGFAFSGDSLGLYVGVDALLQDRDTRTLRGGVFAGFQRGNYWTTGENSIGLPSEEANVRTDTPVVGMYGSVNWSGGTYVDVGLMGQRPTATIAAGGGFKEDVTGNSLTLSSQVGIRFEMADDWTLEPQLLLSASAPRWQDGTAANGQRFVVDDVVLGMARMAVRAEKVFETTAGSRIHPWATLGLQDTVGEKDHVLAVGQAGINAPLQVYPSNEIGLVATLDLGVEAELNEQASLFGALSYGHSVDGSEFEQRQVNIGARVRW